MKRLLIMLSAMLMIFSFTACKKQDEKTVEELQGNSMIEIYYPKGNQVVRAEEKYQIKQPDSVTAAVEEIMLQLKGKLNESMEYHTYMMDTDNNLTLEFVSKGEYDTEYILLARASVAETLFQIEGVNSVKISISDAGGKLISDVLFMRDSFYFYDYEDDDLLNNIEATLYYPSADGSSLDRKKANIPSLPNTTMEETIVNELVDSGALPSDTRVLSVSINADICYLNLSKEFENGVEGVKSETVVYAVVNSITSVTDVSKVQIIIDGEHLKTYRETTDISSPLEFNNSILN